MYTRTHTNEVVRDDGARISTFSGAEFPNTNQDYLDYVAWLGEGNTPANPPLDQIDLFKAQMHAVVNTEYKNRMKAISDLYAQVERESWPIQLAEARAIVANPEATAVWIDTVAGIRGITRQELATRILDKDAQYRMLHGTLTGLKQRAEDAIDAAETYEALDEIDLDGVWDAVIP